MYTYKIFTYQRGGGIPNLLIGSRGCKNKVVFFLGRLGKKPYLCSMKFIRIIPTTLKDGTVVPGVEYVEIIDGVEKVVNKPV